MKVAVDVRCEFINILVDVSHLVTSMYVTN